MDGFLLIDKPAGITSHDVVDRIRRLLRPRTSNLQLPISNFQFPKVGHAGTLDPFATGLLIIGVGRMATREMQKIVKLDKTYEAVFVLGASSTTDDVEGEIIEMPIHLSGSLSSGRGLQPASDRRLKPAATVIKETIRQFIGKFEQIPPTYSAIKIGGKKMYEEARRGRPIKGKVRSVTIYSIEIKNVSELPDSGRLRLSLTIHCSSGTYIRALARDLGQTLGGGGYAEQLRRTSIGPFSVSEAHALEDLTLPNDLPLIPIQAFLGRL